MNKLKFEPIPAIKTKLNANDDSLVMDIVQAKMLNNDYKTSKQGFEVNDGKYLNYVNDNDCKTCKHKLTYFDCSQCHKYDEWQAKWEEK